MANDVTAAIAINWYHPGAHTYKHLTVLTRERGLADILSRRGHFPHNYTLSLASNVRTVWTP